MKKLALCILAGLLLIMPVLAAAPTEIMPIISPAPIYRDLAANWYRAAAETYGDPAIFSDGSGCFYPGKPITRMEFARMLHAALDIHINYFAPIDIGEFYNDVSNEAAGASELYDLVSLGIIDRTGSFGAAEPLSREEMIHYAVRAVDYATGGSYALILMMPAPFADDAEIADSYKNDIVKAVLLQLVEGRGGNRLWPKSEATRAEAVTIADRLVRRVQALASAVSVTAAATENDGGLTLSLTIRNNGSAPITIQHNSGQQFDFKLFDAAGETLYCWSADKMFIQALTATEIGAGEIVEYTAELDSMVYEPIREKVAGIRAYIIGTSEAFNICSDGYAAALPGSVADK